MCVADDDKYERYSELVDMFFWLGLSSEEEEELKSLMDDLDEIEEPYYREVKELLEKN